MPCDDECKSKQVKSFSHDPDPNAFVRVRLRLEVSGSAFISCQVHPNTVEDGQKINNKKLGEHKVITPEEQFLVMILCYFMYLKLPWLLHFFAKTL